jgi:hypothetical protein
MYQEVAFDPECFSEYHYYGLLKSEFGFEKGRYIVAPIRSWVREAVKAVKDSQQIKPIRKQTIKNFLNKMQKNRDVQLVLLPKYRKGISTDNWEEWCQQQVALSPFKSVISESLSESINYEDILEQNPNWVLSPTLQINKKACEIITVIEPLLNFGGEVTIVDQYFSLANNPVLDAVLRVIQNNQSINTVRLVTSVNVKNPDQVFRNDYLNKYANLPKFEFIVAPGKFFHDRYVISGFGAIKSGHGFSEGVEQGAQADNLSISLCGKEEADGTLQWVDTVIEEGKATTTVLHGG